ncbi:unnamed protein product [Lampetra fluviatilis]
MFASALPQGGLRAPAEAGCGEVSRDRVGTHLAAHSQRHSCPLRAPPVPKAIAQCPVAAERRAEPAPLSTATTRSPERTLEAQSCRCHCWRRGLHQKEPSGGVVYSDTCSRRLPHHVTCRSHGQQQMESGPPPPPLLLLLPRGQAGTQRAENHLLRFVTNKHCVTLKEKRNV